MLYKMIKLLYKSKVDSAVAPCFYSTVLYIPVGFFFFLTSTGRVYLVFYTRRQHSERAKLLCSQNPCNAPLDNLTILCEVLGT